MNEYLNDEYANNDDTRCCECNEVAEWFDRDTGNAYCSYCFKKAILDSIGSQNDIDELIEIAGIGYTVSRI